MVICKSLSPYTVMVTTYMYMPIPSSVLCGYKQYPYSYSVMVTMDTPYTVMVTIDTPYTVMVTMDTP